MCGKMESDSKWAGHFPRRIFVFGLKFLSLKLLFKVNRIEVWLAQFGRARVITLINAGSWVQIPHQTFLAKKREFTGN